MRGFLRFLALVATLMAAPVFAGQVVVTGLGTVEMTPDMATINVGVRTDAANASQALENNSVATGEMLTLLSELGIEQRDIQTSNLSLSPVWDNRGSDADSRPHIVAYRVSNNVTVTVRSLGDLGAILDDIVRNGANEFYGLTFGLQNPAPVLDEARVKAIQDAQYKASLYATAAGVELGDILSISEPGASAPEPIVRAEFAARAVAVPVAAGEIGTSAQVTIVYAIADD